MRPETQMDLTEQIAAIAQAPVVVLQTTNRFRKADYERIARLPGITAADVATLREKGVLTKAFVEDQTRPHFPADDVLGGILDVFGDECTRRDVGLIATSARRTISSIVNWQTKVDDFND